MTFLPGSSYEVAHPWSTAISLSGSAPERTLVTAADDGVVRVWTPATGGEPRRLAGHTKAVPGSFPTAKPLPPAAKTRPLAWGLSRANDRIATTPLFSLDILIPPELLTCLQPPLCGTINIREWLFL